MSDVPKCTSWRGHKFEGRYSTRPTKIDPEVMFWSGIIASRELAARSVAKTYEHDICVRCGHIVKREPHQPLR